MKNERNYPGLSSSLLLICLLAACALPTSPANQVTPFPVTLTPAPTVTISPTLTSAPTRTPDLTLTPANVAYARYTIESLRAREYGGGALEVRRKVRAFDRFTRYVIRYTSDGLSISGFADIPNGKGPFPVIIMLHGRSDAENFSIFEQDTGYAEMYAQEGYIVLHPNLRNYRPSDQGDNHLLIGMTVDTLNLIALVKAQAGQDGILKKANADRLGLWAFSMGGAVALKVLTISPNIKSAFLYSPMSGDDHLNARFLAKAGEIEAQQDLTLPSVVFNVSSAQNYFKDITSAVDIHHGLDDTTIPPEQAEKTCDDLRKLGKTINCYFYEDMPHVFAGNGGVKLKLRMVNFFNTHLKAPRGTPAP